MDWRTWKRKGTWSKFSKANIEHTDVIKNNDLNPGASVSTDQYVCRIKGRLLYTRGREDPKECMIYSKDNQVISCGETDMLGK